MDMNKRVQELNKEVGGDFSPFKLACYMGIEVIYQNDLNKILGYYQPSDMNHFYINGNIDIEKQEDVCYQLVTHYAAAKDQELWITDVNLTSLMNYERTMGKIKRAIMNIRKGLYLQKTIKPWK